MISKQTIIDALPPFANEKILIKQKQGTNDIINEILNTHETYAVDYDDIYPYYDTGNIDTTAESLWDFLKYNLVYDAETGKDQTVKTPAAILHEGEKIDCKHYSLYIGGVLDAIKRNEGGNWNWCYRFASYNNEPIPAHVFVVVKVKGREIWIDPVLSSYDQKKSYNFYQDEKPMALYRISGPNGNVGDIVPEMETFEVVVQNQELAYDNFLFMLNMNLFNLKGLLLSNANITYGPLKQWCNIHGFDFQRILNLLNT